MFKAVLSSATPLESAESESWRGFQKTWVVHGQICADPHNDTALLADLLARYIRLAIQVSLLLLGDESALLGRHDALFPANFIIFCAKLICLLFCQFRFLHFLSNLLVLVLQTTADFIAARMSLFPLGIVILRHSPKPPVSKIATKSNTIPNFEAIAKIQKSGKYIDTRSNFLELSLQWHMILM